MLKSLFSKTEKSPHPWIENATLDDVYETFTEVLIKGGPEGIAPALTTAELSAFEKNFEYFSTAAIDPVLSEILSFYAGYPFHPIPLSYNGLLRAAVALTGRDERMLNQKIVSRNEHQEERVIIRGRTKEDGLRLMFSALAGGDPVQEDIIDVLALVQPRQDRPRHLGEEQLRSMAVRLMRPTSLSTENLLISKEKLSEFLKDIHLAKMIEEDVNFVAFKTIVNEKPGFFDAVSRKFDFLFLDS